MSNSDKLLVGIVVAAIALVVVALAVAMRAPAPTYRTPEDTADAVVHNYLLALRKGENERAYGYVSPGLDGYPETVEAFVEDMTRSRWRFPVEDSASAFTIESTEITGDLAVVEVEETRFVEAGLMDSGQVRQSVVFNLRSTPDGWKLTHAERYWTECWENPSGEQCQLELEPDDERPGDEASAGTGEGQAP